MSDYIREPDEMDHGAPVYWAAPASIMVRGGEPCRNCGHAVEYHDVDGECWVHPEPDIPGDDDQICACSNFVPPVRYNLVALEYIGACFLVWRATRRDLRMQLSLTYSDQCYYMMRLGAAFLMWKEARDDELAEAAGRNFDGY